MLSMMKRLKLNLSRKGKKWLNRKSSTKTCNSKPMGVFAQDNSLKLISCSNSEKKLVLAFKWCKTTTCHGPKPKFPSLRISKKS